jgi:hypothetical protein
MPQSRQGPTSDSLPLLYGAMAAGVLLYAAVLVFVLQPQPGAVAPGPLRIGWLVVAVGVTLLAGVIQQRVRAGAADDASRATNAVLVWAAVEGQALLGLTGYYLTGDRLLLILPLVLFVYLFLRNPPAAFRARG